MITGTTSKATGMIIILEMLLLPLQKNYCCYALVKSHKYMENYIFNGVDQKYLAMFNIYGSLPENI